MIRFRVLKSLVAESTVTKTYEVIILEPQESTVTYAGNGHARWPIIEVPVVLRRFAHYYIVNFIIPLLCMILMAWTWLFIRREGGPGKVGEEIISHAAPAALVDRIVTIAHRKAAKKICEF